VHDAPEELGCGSFYQNAFGLLRNRDNTEGNPFVTRFGGTLCDANTFDIGSLSKYDECLENITEGITEFVDCFNFDVHARAHIGIGGSRPAYDGQPSVGWPFCQFWHGASWSKINGVRKWAQRYGCFECPDAGSCTYDPNEEFANWECAQCRLTNDSNVCVIEGVEKLILGERNEQQTHGDFLDQSTSPNDPIFMMHHANLDRYLTDWQLRNYDQRPYYGYPTEGYQDGFRLDDVLSANFPFTGLFTEESGIGDGPYTARDIWDGTTILDAEYVYDTVLDLIVRDDSSDSESVSDSDDSNDSDSMDSDDSMDFSTTEAVITVARNSFIGGSRRSAANAVGSESDTVSDLLATDGDSENDHVTISLSKDTLMNLWALCAVVVLMNITLCVWCQCKRNKAAKAQRFVSDDPYESERNVNV